MTNFGRRRSIAADRALRGILLGALCLAAASSGCAHQDTTPVARGEYYASGKPDYDEFFVKLYRHQLDTANALKAEQAARSELAHAVGAAPNTKPSELAPSLQKMAGELEQSGVEVTVPAPSSGGALELEVRGEPKGDQAKQIEAVRTATRMLRGLERMARDGGTELDALRTRSIELDREVDRVFWTDGAGKRAEVKNNLSDARELIALMNDSRKDLGQSSTQLLALLQVTFKSKEPAPVAEAEENEEPSKGKKKGRSSGKRANASKKGKPGSKSTARPTRASAEAAAPASKPAPSKPSPAPKAEFEP
jgi:hypothetical protein